MKNKSIVLVLLISFNLVAYGQEVLQEYGLTAGVLVPLKTAHGEPTIGYGITGFDEILITQRLSLYSGAGMYIIRVKERDEYLDEYQQWTNLDVMVDVGPKLYFGNLYSKMGFGLLFGESYSFAFRPGIGYRFDRIDLGVSYNHSSEFAFFEFGLSVYFY